MSKELDAIFSAESLRKNWKSPKPAKEEVREKKESGPGDALTYLRRSVKDRFSGDDLFALNLLLDELASQLGLLDNPEIVQAAHETLNLIEDLLESYEVRDRDEAASG